MSTTSSANLAGQSVTTSRLRVIDTPNYRSVDAPSFGHALRSPRKSRQSVLIAGDDDQRRAVLRSELAISLAAQTQFVEANAAWEVLQRAPSSRMVVLVGDLKDISADSLTRLLGRRHPELPVLTLDNDSASVDCSEDLLRSVNFPVGAI